MYFCILSDRSMKLNLVLLLTDLFNLFEIHPAKCVCYPGMDGQGKWSLYLSCYPHNPLHRIASIPSIIPQIDPHHPTDWPACVSIYQSGACIVVQVLSKVSLFAFRSVFVFNMICFNLLNCFCFFYFCKREQLVNRNT